MTKEEMVDKILEKAQNVEEKKITMMKRTKKQIEFNYNYLKKHNFGDIENIIVIAILLSTRGILNKIGK